MPWQVVPAASARVMEALLGTVRLDIPTLERAYAGDIAA